MPAVIPFRTRGACPGVFDPMETGDGWLVRVRLPGGSVTTAQLLALAAVAGELGSGAIDLTSRANIQIRGLGFEDLPRTGALLVDAGLAQPESRLDALRSIVASPLAGHDPTAVVDATPVVREIGERLRAEVDGSVPSKFLVALDDGGAWPLHGVDADVMLSAARRSRGVMWAVTSRGASRPVGETDDPGQVAVQVARTCAAAGARTDVVASGVETYVPADALGLRPVTTRRSRTQGPHRHPGPGVHPHLAADRCNVVAAPFLGRLDATTLGALATIVEPVGAVVRVTTQRSLALCGVPRAQAPTLLDHLRDLGMVVAADDPRGLLSACVGSRGCRSAYADTVAVAERLAAGGITEPLHLSGCAKCCGAPTGPGSLVADERGAFAPREERE